MGFCDCDATRKKCPAKKKFFWREKCCALECLHLWRICAKIKRCNADCNGFFVTSDTSGGRVDFVYWE